ncbi:hypothetical protein MRB53_013634 [Persea americana]|uniref:Uncharacterized protein n=1 Tax=Persea americana TaxID=3435 RepID=A0ACC2K8T3_PERAE|nr:hypothetical protein MRB53_013634 [Persea americana]
MAKALQIPQSLPLLGPPNPSTKKGKNSFLPWFDGHLLPLLISSLTPIFVPRFAPPRAPGLSTSDMPPLLRASSTFIFFPLRSALLLCCKPGFRSGELISSPPHFLLEKMGMVAPRWSQQGWPSYQIMSLETEIGMAVARGSRPGAAVGELGLQYPLGTESLDDSEDPHRGRRQSSNQKRFSLFFRRRRNEKGKSPVEAER